MSNCRRLRPLILGLVILAGPVPAAMAAPPAVQDQRTARLWFLRPTSAASEIQGAAPTVYANGTPIAVIPGNGAFYRDFTPGTCSFAVQPYGAPTGQEDTLQLSPGTQTYLEIQWVPTWEEGYPSGRGTESHSFFVLNLSPEVARAYLPSLTFRGQH
jgi:hypothetical protein